MMNCTQTQHNLIAYVRGQLESVQASALIGHVSHCQQCRAKLEEERLLQDMFQQYRVPAAKADFESRVLHNALKQHRNNKSQFHKGLITALAACLVIWVSVMFINPVTPDNNNLPSVSLKVNEVKQVRFTFNAPKNFNKVTISLQLPKHIELEGYPGEKELRWETALSEGANILTLPVIATDAQSGNIIATISNGKDLKKFRISMNAITDNRKI